MKNLKKPAHEKGRPQHAEDGQPFHYPSVTHEQAPDLRTAHLEPLGAYRVDTVTHPNALPKGVRQRNVGGYVGVGPNYTGAAALVAVRVSSFLCYTYKVFGVNGL